MEFNEQQVKEMKLRCRVIASNVINVQEALEGQIQDEKLADSIDFMLKRCREEADELYVAFGPELKQS